MSCRALRARAGSRRSAGCARTRAGDAGDAEFAWRPRLAAAVRAVGLPRRVAWPLRLRGAVAGEPAAREALRMRAPDLQVGSLAGFVGPHSCARRTGAPWRCCHVKRSVRRPPQGPAASAAAELTRARAAAGRRRGAAAAARRRGGARRGLAPADGASGAPLRAPTRPRLHPAGRCAAAPGPHRRPARRRLPPAAARRCRPRVRVSSEGAARRRRGGRHGRRGERRALAQPRDRAGGAWFGC